MSDSIPSSKILFVCLGNICRSPAAEIIFRHMVAEADLTDFYQIDSAGTAGFHEGAAPDHRMAATLARHGYTIAGHARKITRADLDAYDYIITMDEENHRDVCLLDKTAGSHPKVKPLMSFCTEHTDQRVPDPYYGGQKGFDHVISLLEDACRNLLRQTRPQ